MAEISKITLPNGVSYDIKDKTARDSIATLLAGGWFEVVDTLPTASAATVGKIYLASRTPSAGNSYNEFITVVGGTTEVPTYTWEKIGSTDIDLTPYSKKTHTHSVTPNITLTGAAYTPAGEITDASFNGTEGDVSVSGTTDGTVGTPGINIKNTDGTAITLYSMSGEGSYTESNYTPESYNVSNETLVITQSNYTKEQVTMPSRVQANVTATAPSFTGKTITSTGKFTPEGGVSATFQGTAAIITPTINNGTTTIATSAASE